jgi:hypothetical protein
VLGFRWPSSIFRIDQIHHHLFSGAKINFHFLQAKGLAKSLKMNRLLS